MISLLPKRFVKLISPANCLSRTILFTNEGGELLMFELLNNGWTKSSQCCIFERNNLYGIKFNNDHSRLCAFGDRFFKSAYVNYNDDSLSLNCEKQFFAEDWIFNVQFLKFGSVALLLAHNVVKIFNTATETFVFNVQCDESSLLYSGKFLGSDQSELVVLAGTVFNEILLWTPTCDKNVVHRLTGHEGVVFGIDFCPTRKLLCSVADDRSCRIWKFECSSQFMCSWPVPAESWSKGTFVQLHVLYGHEARVWSALWLPPFTSAGGLVTVGEDGFVNLWTVDTWTLMRSWRKNRGGIRSVAFDQLKLVLICGSDSGSIFSLNLSLDDEKQSKFDKIHLLDEDEGIADLCLTRSLFLCVSSKGSVFVAYDEKDPYRLFKDDNLRYTCWAKSDKWLSLGGLAGAIYLISTDDPTIWSRTTFGTSKIVNLHFVDDGERLLCCSSDAEFLLCVVDVDSGKIVESSISLPLPEGKHRWITCAVWIQVDNRTFLIFGDKNGSIAFYEINENATPDICINRQVFSKVHESHGVTDLMIDEEQVVHSIGRDGEWRQWTFDSTQWSLCSKCKVGQNFEWPAKFLQLDAQILVAGFKGNKFTVFDTIGRNFLCDVECGGGKRSCDLSMDSEKHCLTFVFTKAGEVFNVKVDLGGETEILPSAHTRQIKHSARFANLNEDDDTVYFATASEDTTIAIWAQTKDQLKVVQRLKAHISSVHCLLVVDDFLISGGGRGEVCLWNKRTKSYVLVGRYKTQEDARYLSANIGRSTDDEFDILCAVRSDGIANFFVLDRNNKTLKQISQFAKADCCLNKVKCARHFAFIVGTSGTLLVVDLKKLNSNDAVPSSSNRETKSKKNKRNRNQEALNDQANQPRVSQIEWDLVVPVENGGLTALDVKLVENDQKLLCIVGSESGGLSFVLLSVLPSIACLSVTNFPLWHASTIVDLCLTQKDYVYSLSTDQRICGWRLEFDETDQKFQLSYSTSIFTHVADPSCLWIQSKSTIKIFIGGAGFQML